MSYLSETKVVILCGGKGTRISEETHLKPKPLIQIGNHPILFHIMKTYANYNFKNFVLALGYKGQLIKDYFLNYQNISNSISLDMKNDKVSKLTQENLDWNIEMIDTGAEVMTGGRLLRLVNSLEKAENFMLTYGDGLCNVNIESLLQFHLDHKKIATVTAVKPQARFGSLKIKNSLVTSFEEKNIDNQDWINGGYFIFNRKIFEYLKDDSTILERRPLEELAKRGELAAYQHKGYWQCMDTLRDKEILEQDYNNGEPLWFVD